MATDTCGICGGDGRIANAFANTATCPACHGSGRRADQGGFRDVTKTKPSHHRQPQQAQAAEKKPQWPSTLGGIELAKEVQASGNVSNDTKAKLTREILEYEASHGQCTRTFIKKIRLQIRPPSA